MKCKHCGAKNRDSAKFCASCGEKIGRSTVERAGSDHATRPGRRLVVLMVAVASVVVAALFLLDGKTLTQVGAVDGMVRIPLSGVSDGNAHYFSYDAGGTRVDFFVLKAPDGVIRAALDTCDVCYKEKKGYRQEGAAMICKNCDNVFPADQINVQRGGCNPVPLERRIEGAELVLSARELAACAGYFRAG